MSTTGKGVGMSCWFAADGTSIARRWSMMTVVLATAAIAILSLLGAQTTAARGGGQIGESFGTPGVGNGQFFNPAMLGVDSQNGTIYTGDYNGVLTTEASNYRIQQLSPSGEFKASAEIKRFPEAGKNVGLQGIAVDHELGRIYIVESCRVANTGGTFACRAIAGGKYAARKILVYSTTPEGEKLKALSSIALPEGEKEIYEPKAIAVDPSNHDLLILGEENAKHAVIQRVSSAGVLGARFVDSSDVLHPNTGAESFASSLAVSNTGETYTLTGLSNPGSEFTRAFQLPPSLATVEARNGFDAGQARGQLEGAGEFGAGVAEAGERVGLAGVGDRQGAGEAFRAGVGVQHVGGVDEASPEHAGGADSLDDGMFGVFFAEDQEVVVGGVDRDRLRFIDLFFTFGQGDRAQRFEFFPFGRGRVDENLARRVLAAGDRTAGEGAAGVRHPARFDDVDAAQFMVDGDPLQADVLARFGEAFDFRGGFEFAAGRKLLDPVVGGFGGQHAVVVAGIDRAVLGIHAEHRRVEELAVADPRGAEGFTDLTTAAGGGGPDDHGAEGEHHDARKERTPTSHGYALGSHGLDNSSSTSVGRVNIARISCDKAVKTGVPNPAFTRLCRALA